MQRNQDTSTACKIACKPCMQFCNVYLQPSLIVCVLLFFCFSDQDFNTPANTVANLGQRPRRCRLVTLTSPWQYTSLDAKPPVVCVDACQTVPGTDSRYQVDESGGSCNLVISGLTLDLSGTYTCQDPWGEMAS